MRDGLIGYIDTPAQGNKRPDDVQWCADNGCYSDKWDEAKWWRFLESNARAADTCLFAVAPDVVGDAAATLVKSAPWLPKIRALGYAAALVAQDGLEFLDVPWDSFDVLFVGGVRQFAYSPRTGLAITEWKEGPHARRLAYEAKKRGKRVHVGRVNSQRRFRIAAAPYPYGHGAHSCDGTYLTRGADVNLPRLLAWTRTADQAALFEGWSA